MKKLTFLFLSAIMATACSKDENGKVNLQFKGINENHKTVFNIEASPDVRITDFKLSFREVEFKPEESAATGEVKFMGPYDVDLMSETQALTQSIGTAELADGTYKLIRFKLHKSTERETSDLLYDRSIYMSGTIDGTPFIFWHDASENFDIENMNGITVAGNEVSVGVVFNMDQFLNSSVNIDLSNAIDEDEDGVIEINPDNDDGNSKIADDLKTNIKEAADMVKL